MGIFGKIIGGALGCTIGGPLGGIIGVAIGHEFDKKNRPQSENRGTENEQSGMYDSPNAQMTFFAATFSMLGKMANADGNISQNERNTVETFIDMDLKLSPQDKAFALRIFDTAANSSEEFSKFAEQFYQCFARQPQMIEMMMDILVRLSYADGNLAAREAQFIAVAAMCFRYPAASVDMLKTKYKRSSGYGSGSENGRNTRQEKSDANSLEWAYSVLGCSSIDSDSDIKARYKKLVKEYHPDVIASKGLPEEFTEFANKKFQQIQSAYEIVKKKRGL